MHLTALLDFDAVPRDTDDAVSVLVDITAPEREEDTERPPATLQVVLDRSGSMGGGRLDGAVRALLSLVERLAPSDNFGLVSFNDQARVEVPCGPLEDKARVRRLISGLHASGGTDLSSGLMRGVQEARRAGADRGGTLLLISDGHANQGVTDHDLLRQVSADAYSHGVATTTLGYGLGYDEELLGAVADGGAGSALFAEDPDTAGGLIAQEAEYLLAKTAQAVSLRVPSGPLLRAVSVVGEMPSHRLADGSVVVELGDFHSGERRRLLLRLEVSGLSAPGTVAALEVTYADPVTLASRTVSLPVELGVVAQDAADERVPRPEVRAEEVLQRAQTAKRRASEAMRRGDRFGAAGLLEEARMDLADRIQPVAPAGTAEYASRAGAVEHVTREAPPPEVLAQMEELRRMAGMTRTGNASRVSKSLYASQAGYSRKSGRQRPGAAQDGGQRAGGDGDRAEQDPTGGARDGASGPGQGPGPEAGGGGPGRGSGRGRRGRLIRGQQTDGGRPTPDGGAPPPQES
ncbi:VWA domain-containing protein [Nocardiopsis dassonvillei]|uniref:VWA domain-containing protein n=1 Tax=Nocardiopsis dassonvillei TaxID=2014 RepID=UPI00200D93C3|nr:VWA domain-containing protein [Nocardiopsis dassonvillei]MCK9870416.1 VWA domain-containing protein [Nocardiopsis dassonvillei]